MKFVNSKFGIVLAFLIIILAISLKHIQSSEVVSSSLSQAEAKSKTVMKNKSKSGLKIKSKARKNYSFERPPGASVGSADQTQKNNSNLNKILGSQSSVDIILNDWLMISSSTFKNSAVFPEIFMGYISDNIKIRVDEADFRLNDAHEKDKNPNNQPSQNKLFWFRLSKEQIFYSSTKEDLNILGGHKIEHIVDALSLKKNEHGFYCFTIIDRSGHDWTICSTDENIRNKWFCQIQTLRKKPLEKYCNGDSDDANIVYKNVNL
jgi:hypothetical protein